MSMNVLTKFPHVMPKILIGLRYWQQQSLGAAEYQFRSNLNFRHSQTTMRLSDHGCKWLFETKGHRYHDDFYFKDILSRNFILNILAKLVTQTSRKIKLIHWFKCKDSACL